MDDSGNTLILTVGTVIVALISTFGPSLAEKLIRTPAEPEPASPRDWRDERIDELEQDNSRLRAEISELLVLVRHP